VRVLGILTQYTADNPGLEEAFGIDPSFNYDGCCALCYDSRDDMRRIFRENQLGMRTSGIEGDGNVGRFIGIKRSGVLIQLLYYHIMNNIKLTTQCRRFQKV
jgi:hypothetical protein